MAQIQSHLRKPIIKGLLLFFAPSTLFFINRSLALLYKSFQPNSLDVWLKMADMEIYIFLVPGTWLIILMIYFGSHILRKSKKVHAVILCLLGFGLLAGLFITWIGLYSIWLKYSGIGP